jgi:cytochrome c-type biogenesis protein CcmH
VLAIVWFIAGLAIGVLTCWFALRVAPRLRAVVRTRNSYLLAGGLIAAFAVAATILELAVSARHSGPAEAAHASAAAPGAAGTSAPPAQSMDAAVARLEARLARAGGSDADWELLAKAYEFVGRSDDARRARAHAVTPSPGLTAATTSMETLAAAAAAAGNTTASGPAPAASLEELQRRVHDQPGDASAWLALAELDRERHDNAAARDALAKVVALHGMTAQSWADYADVLGSLAGNSLSGAAGNAIDQALALDPNNAKALWLKASQAHEQRHFADALTFWHRLRAALPADSPDVRIIDANIAEDTQLAGAAAAAQGVRVSVN